MKVPRPLYIATVALGLAAGLSFSLRSNPESDGSMANVMRTLGFKDKREFLIATSMLDQLKIESLDNEQTSELERLLNARGAQKEVGLGILSNLTSQDLIKQFLPSLISVKAVDPSNPHIASILSSWYASGGKTLIQNISNGSGPLSQEAKGIVKDE